MSDCGCEIEVESAAQAQVLWILLAINGAMFVAEFGAGLAAESAGLIADSFDMLADATVYGVSLWAVARSTVARASAVRLSGYFQLGLGVAALGEVVRRLDICLGNRAGARRRKRASDAVSSPSRTNVRFYVI